MHFPANAVLSLPNVKELPILITTLELTISGHSLTDNKYQAFGFNKTAILSISHYSLSINHKYFQKLNIYAQIHVN